LREVTKMITIVTRHPFAAVAIAALLSGCGGLSPATTPSGAFGAVHIGSKTFHYTGHEARFLVPSGVTMLSVRLRGARGAGWPVYYTNFPPLYGRGGRVDAEIPVKPGETLYVNVGGKPGGSGVGGFNGGGNSGTGSGSNYEGAAGGGASDVREGGDTLKDRILVAGGGGGMGCCFESGDSSGGSGGGETGVTGSPSAYGGGGGSQTQGGAGGAGEPGYGSQSGGTGGNGGFGAGGSGGNGAKQSGYTTGGSGGGGGGGYYGGGGGGGGGPNYGRGEPRRLPKPAYYGFAGAGGGGGSSYVEPSATKSHMWQGWKNATGNGAVVFSWQYPLR
jgi:hypothetical protein